MQVRSQSVARDSKVEIDQFSACRDSSVGSVKGNILYRSESPANILNHAQPRVTCVCFFSAQRLVLVRLPVEDRTGGTIGFRSKSMYVTRGHSKQLGALIGKSTAKVGRYQLGLSSKKISDMTW